jgi:hypothetical protein
MDWRCDASHRGPTLQALCSKFKLRSYQKEKEIERQREIWHNRREPKGTEWSDMDTWKGNHEVVGKIKERFSSEL